MEPPPPLSEPRPKVLRARQDSGWGVYVLAVAVVVVIGLVVVWVLEAGPGFWARQRVMNELQDRQAILKPVEPPPPLTAVQQEALAKFGQELARAITHRDMAKVARLADDDALASRVFEKLPDAFETAGVRAGYLQILRRVGGGWIQELMGGKAEYLRSREREGFPAVLLRVFNGKENYVEVLVRVEGDGFRAVDVFSRLLAQMRSEVACHVIASEAVEPAAGALATLPGVPMGMGPEGIEKLPAVLQAIRYSTATQALYACDEMPAEARSMPLVFRLRLRAMRLMSNDGAWDNVRAFKEALRAAPGILGQDCTTDLLLADLLGREQKLAEVEECLKRAEVVVGGDPLLKMSRVWNLRAMKNPAEALSLLDAMEKESGRNEKSADIRILLLLDQKDYPAVVETLRAFKASFGVVLGRRNYFGALAQTEFMASPEFAAWEAENGAAAGAGAAAPVGAGQSR